MVNHIRDYNQPDKCRTRLQKLRPIIDSLSHPELYNDNCLTTIWHRIHPNPSGSSGYPKQGCNSWYIYIIHNNICHICQCRNQNSGSYSSPSHKQHMETSKFKGYHQQKWPHFTLKYIEEESLKNIKIMIG